jgi:hypothetical protein
MLHILSLLIVVAVIVARVTAVQRSSLANELNRQVQLGSSLRNGDLKFDMPLALRETPSLADIPPGIAFVHYNFYGAPINSSLCCLVTVTFV